MDGSQSSLPPDVRRHKFTAADVQAMLEAGVLREGDHRIELIGGELVEMSPQGPLHWDVTQKLVSWLFRHIPGSMDVASQGPLRLSEFDEPEPEILVFPAGLHVNNVRGPDTILVAEVAHSSLRIDLKVKAPLYASHGVREYWIVDVEARRTLVHRLDDGLYPEPEAVPFDAPLTAPGGAELVIASILPASKP